MGRREATAIGRVVVGWLALLAACGPSSGQSIDAGDDDDGPDAGGALPAPTDVTASDGTFLDHVLITWSAASGATSYRLERDGSLLAEVSEANYLDTTADPGDAPGGPGLSASQGTMLNRVELVWTPAIPPAGEPHLYTVTAVGPAGDSDPSAPDSGHRGAYPVTGYQLSLDDGASYTDLGLVAIYNDTTAPPGAIVPGQAVASDGAHTTHITLGLVGTLAMPGASRNYLVRGVNAAGTGDATAAAGFRGLGALTYQWQRSAGDSDALYADVGGAVQATYDDTGAPINEEGRHYRCRLSATGADPALSATDRGWRRNALSSTPIDDFWITDGAVHALAQDGNAIYLGGDFSYVGPATGSFAAIDAVSALPDTVRARVDGTIYTATADGAGGWYVGGVFSNVDGVPRENAAHIDATGALDPLWRPDPDSDVAALVRSGDLVIAAGGFGFIGGGVRDYLAALDATTGQATMWAPYPDSPVTSLAVSDGVLYVSGTFSNLAGVDRQYLAAFDMITWQPLPWDPTPSGGNVLALAVDGSTVYVGGWFTQVGGQPRNRIAAVDATTGNPTTWNPGASAPVRDILVSGGAVYVAGEFTTIAGQVRRRAAAFDPVTGALTAWNPDAGGAVNTLAINGPTVYLGGEFTSLSGQPRDRLAAVDATTGTLTTWNPGAGGSVYALAADGAQVVAGGNFLSVGGQRRYGLAALDVVTGAATSWSPRSNGLVRALALHQGTVYAGGSFSTVDDQPRSRLAAIDASSGTLNNWNPGADGDVYALTADASTVYIGGLFTLVRGETRYRIAAVDVASAIPTSWNPGADWSVTSLVVGNGVVYVGGGFDLIAGVNRRGLAALDQTTGTATAWDPAPWPYPRIRALALAGNLLYVAGDYTTIGGATRLGLAAVDTTTGLANGWAPNPGPLEASVVAIAVTGNSVYLGGFFSSFGPLERWGLAEADAAIGAFSTWDPNAGNGPIVRALLTSAAGDRVYVGGDLWDIGGRVQRGFAVFGP